MHYHRLKARLMHAATWLTRPAVAVMQIYEHNENDQFGTGPTTKLKKSLQGHKKEKMSNLYWIITSYVHCTILENKSTFGKTWQKDHKTHILLNKCIKWMWFPLKSFPDVISEKWNYSSKWCENVSVSWPLNESDRQSHISKPFLRSIFISTYNLSSQSMPVRTIKLWLHTHHHLHSTAQHSRFNSFTFAFYPPLFPLVSF